MVEVQKEVVVSNFAEPEYLVSNFRHAVGNHIGDEIIWSSLQLKVYPILKKSQKENGVELHLDLRGEKIYVTPWKGEALTVEELCKRIRSFADKIEEDFSGRSEA